jgi:hypothetical protein
MSPSRNIVLGKEKYGASSDMHCEEGIQHLMGELVTTS